MDEREQRSETVYASLLFRISSRMDTRSHVATEGSKHATIISATSVTVKDTILNFKILILKLVGVPPY